MDDGPRFERPPNAESKQRQSSWPSSACCSCRVASAICKRSECHRTTSQPTAPESSPRAHFSQDDGNEVMPERGRGHPSPHHPSASWRTTVQSVPRTRARAGTEKRGRYGLRDRRGERSGRISGRGRALDE
ncbi:hypothetical protein LZ30DRAFT_738130 [Colletotrichum cereale]|nr:hypothetical protein LZ30DRAFT_738130 [Colletotrichum cereale]